MARRKDQMNTMPKMSVMRGLGFVVVGMDIDGNCHMRNAFGQEVLAEDDTLGEVRRPTLARRIANATPTTVHVGGTREHFARNDRREDGYMFVTLSGRRKAINIRPISAGKRGPKLAKRDYILRAQRTNIIPVGM